MGEAFDAKVVYLGKDVLTATKERIHRMYNEFDHVIVSFSGGKDSMVVMEMAREVMDERGEADKPVRFQFNDEEVIPDDVIETVQRYYDDPRYEGYWVAVPCLSNMLIVGEQRNYVQWDPARAGNYVREKPAHAVTQIHPDNHPVSQTEISALLYMTMGLKGRIATLNGIRAKESPIRFRSCFARRNEDNYICGDPNGAKNISFVKVVFDWSQNDVFKYFFDRGIKYAPIYDNQMLAGNALRVSTPLHENSFEMLVRLRVTYPKFYEQIISIWPEVATHERYWKSHDIMGIMDRYPPTWEGMFTYIKENIPDPLKAKQARARLKTAYAYKARNKRQGKYTDCAFGFPIRYVWKCLVTGNYKRGIQLCTMPTPSDLAFEATLVKAGS